MSSVQSDSAPNVISGELPVQLLVSKLFRSRSASGSSQLFICTSMLGDVLCLAAETQLAKGLPEQLPRKAGSLLKKKSPRRVPLSISRRGRNTNADTIMQQKKKNMTHS